MKNIKHRIALWLIKKLRILYIELQAYLVKRRFEQDRQDYQRGFDWAMHEILTENMTAVEIENYIPPVNNLTPYRQGVKDGWEWTCDVWREFDNRMNKRYLDNYEHSE